MMVSRRALLFAIPLFALLGVLALCSRRESSHEDSAYSEFTVLKKAPPQAVASSTTAPASARAPAAPPPDASSTPSATAPAAATPSDDSLASEMHGFEDSDPERALEIARKGQSLWPDGPRAAEFAAVEVKCLYRLGNPGAGRGKAEAMVNKYVGSPWAIEVERQTGAHAYVNH